jgi:class 3 adenylate cyclase
VDYVHKPVSPSLLITRVRTHLSLQTALREARRHEAEANRLLDVLMPPIISRELRETGTVAPRVREGVAVLFADLVGFTRWCNQRSAEQVVAGLQEVIMVLEDIARQHEVEKLKTIGDAFMGAAGLMTDDPSAARRTVECGIEMARAIDQMDNEWALRVGIQVGPVVAGVIGRQRFRFDIWGDTVNQSSRLCDLARSGAVCISRSLALQLGFEGHDAESVQMKGVGAVEVVHLFPFPR